MKRVLLVAAIIGVVVLLAKRQAAQRAEWHGLTETQVREKLDDRLPGAMPDEARAVVAEKIVEKMRTRGVIVDDNPDIDLTESTVDADTVAEEDSAPTP